MPLRGRWCQFEPGRFPEAEFRGVVHIGSQGEPHLITGEIGRQGFVAPMNARPARGRPSPTQRFPVTSFLTYSDADISDIKRPSDLAGTPFQVGLLLDDSDQGLKGDEVERVIVVRRSPNRG